MSSQIASVAETPKPRKKIRIRPMKRGDIPSVVLIENASFQYRWTATNFLECVLTKYYVALVAENEAEEIIAYIIYAKARVSSDTGWEPYAEIVNFAVGLAARNQGVGTQLIDELVKILPGKKFKGLFMMVRETNVIAQVFFRTNGLRAEYTAYNQYKETKEAGYMMMRHFAEA